MRKKSFKKLERNNLVRKKKERRYGIERLTTREGKYTVRVGNEWKSNDSAWLRLAEYEDTGFTPDEIKDALEYYRTTHPSQLKQRLEEWKQSSGYATMSQEELEEHANQMREDLKQYREMHSNDYYQIRAKAEQMPDYKKEVYNLDFATSKHAEKLNYADEAYNSEYYNK